MAIPYHAARPFTVREAVIKAQTTEGDWTILNSTEVTFDTLNYKVRHVLLRFSCGYLIQRNTAAIDYTLERGAVAQRFFRHLISRLNIVRGGMPDDHYRDREFSEYFGRLARSLHLLSRLLELFIQLLFVAGEK